MRSNPVFETRKAVAAQGEDRLQDSREVTLRHAFKALGEMVRRIPILTALSIWSRAIPLPCIWHATMLCLKADTPSGRKLASFRVARRVSKNRQ